MLAPNFGSGCDLANGERNDGIASFTGKERDAETGLDYFGARYISSAQGRFTSPDPLVWQMWSSEPSAARAAFREIIGDPQNFNLYAYVRNNPLKFVDPDGLKYRVCDNGGSCSDLSDAEFEKEKKRTQSAGEQFKKGQFYHYDENGKKVVDGTYKRTDVDLDPKAQFVVSQTGQRLEHANDFLVGFAGASKAGRPRCGNK